MRIQVASHTTQAEVIMQGFILADYGLDSYYVHMVVMRDTVEEAAKVIGAKIVTKIGNTAMVKISRANLAAINCCTLNFRVQRSEEQEEYLDHLRLCPVPMIYAQIAE